MWRTAPGHAPALAGMVLLLSTWVLIRVGARLYAAAGFRLAREWRARLLAAPLSVRFGVALAVVSGGAHLALVAGGHDPLTRFLFLVDGVALLAIAPIAFTALPWRLPASGLLGGTVLAYLLYVLAGFETPDQAGLSAKLLEIAAIGLLVVPVGRVRHGWLRWSAVAVGVPVLTVGTFLGAWGVSLARPDAQHRHLGATIQVTNVAPTAEQTAAAEQLRMQTTAAIQRYKDPRAAIAAGYKPASGTGALHWINDQNQKHGSPLDPEHPAGLVYVRSHEGLVLVGAMFETSRPGLFGPSPGGPLTAWHEHEHVCFSPFGGGVFSLESPLATCPVGSVSITAPPMLHVWIVSNPGGPFAIDLDPRVVHGIEAS